MSGDAYEKEIPWGKFTTLVIVLSVALGFVLPTGFNLYKRYHYQSVLALSEHYKQHVTSCLLETQGRFSACSAGAYGIPKNIFHDPKYHPVATVIVKHGVITLTPKNTQGIEEFETLVLTPLYQTGKVHWVKSGGACVSHLVQNCHVAHADIPEELQ